MSVFLKLSLYDYLLTFTTTEEEEEEDVTKALASSHSWYWDAPL